MHGAARHHEDIGPGKNAVGIVLVFEQITGMGQRAGNLGFLDALFHLPLGHRAILLDEASVLYTFYPPLQAHWLFYIGLTLVVVGSWVRHPPKSSYLPESRLR